MRMLLMLLLTFSLATACEAQQKPKGARADSAANVVYVDVRTDAEWEAGHVKGAVHVPVEQLEQRWQELERLRERPLVVYCRSGRRSGIAIELLKAKGFTRLENGGGLEQMAARGLAIVKGK